MIAIPHLIDPNKLNVIFRTRINLKFKTLMYSKFMFLSLIYLG